MTKTSGIFTIPYPSPPRFVASVLALLENGKPYIKIGFFDGDDYICAGSSNEVTTLSFRREIAEHLVGVLEVNVACAARLIASTDEMDTMSDGAVPIPPVDVRAPSRGQPGWVKVSSACEGGAMRVARDADHTSVYLSPTYTAVLCRAVILELARIATAN